MLSAAESWNSTVITEMLSASSNSMVLSILWARRYKISNNLISTSKFHKLPKLAAPVRPNQWTTLGREGPLGWDLAQKSWTYTLLMSQYSQGNLPRKELLECSSPGHHWASHEAWELWIRFPSESCSEDKLPHHHLSTFVPQESNFLEKVAEPAWFSPLLLSDFLRNYWLETRILNLELLSLSLNIKKTT